ncbi:pullulanase [Halalkalibacter alkalisediminis]|uniref:pullulanase n=1 Tax=Halalkalibacter alkalisediminis TaxID=935616 RepID=UPI00362D5FEB
MNKVVVVMMIFLMLFSLSDFPISNPVAAEPQTGQQIGANDIGENTLRIHYQRDDHIFNNWGLWFWEDVASPSENWPTGGISFSEEQVTNYGAYIDIDLKENAKKVGFLVLNTINGDKEGGDKEIELFSSNLNEVWIKQGSDEVFLFEPVNLSDNMVRIHYERADQSYKKWGLWMWKDVAVSSEETGGWPTGATAFSDDQVGSHGAYVDVELKEDAKEMGFLVVNRENGDIKDGEDKGFSMLNEYNQLFIKEGDDVVYTNPYGQVPVWMTSGELLSETKIQITFSNTANLSEADLTEEITIKDKDGNDVSFETVVVINDRKVTINGYFNAELAPFSVSYGEQSVTVGSGWRLIDEMYGYDGNLGATLHNDGTATLKLWSPKAESVSVILYDKEEQSKVIRNDIEMTKRDRGVWEVILNEKNTGLTSLKNYVYHYEIEHNGEKKLALDPYAKSMAAWSNLGNDPIGKAAIVDPSLIGPELSFAKIDGFEKREDAIIYEVHVRDFTSDPSIEAELTAQFGTFKAFIDKLDYIQDLGVTHVQLLPIMSYFWGDEWANAERMLEYASTGTNFNWGYDPHSYFSLTGMYSENPNDPELRINEFKMLVDAIHSRGMGVVLDVVYNHTAKVEIFEDLVPNYYHFMDADGTARTSFGGGRLGTTHEMARRILVDSITYWVDEFKVDGFRFDMMGDHDAESIQIAYDKAKELNPNIIMIGEGWRTFVGDEGEGDIMPADQDWMQHTESVGVFSDEFRNELKSGFGSEGQPRFITGGARNIQQIFDNIKAQPHNFVATDPGDVVQYIAAHDNLTLHDVIAQSIKKDPEFHQEEIHQRIRIGNAMVLTAQGKAFIHAGQEFGRTKQFRADTEKAPYKSTYVEDADGKPFTYPYFIHDSYDSTDAINMIDWTRATNAELYSINNRTREYTTGLIKLRKSTDAFRLGTKELIDSNVTLIEAEEINDQDLVIGYRNEATNGDAYYVFINADTVERTLTLNTDLTDGAVVVDSDEAGISEVTDRSGFTLTADSIQIDPLTTVVVKMASIKEDDENPLTPVEPNDPEESDETKPAHPVDRIKDKGKVEKEVKNRIKQKRKKKKKKIR